MKLYYDRRSKNPTYFIQQGIRNGKKTTTRNIKKIGRHNDLLRITDDPRFKGISKNQSYYINKQGELVICFDQFEVAPGYMGNPTFTIKNDLLDDYFK